MVQRRAIGWTQHSYSTYASITQMQNELWLRSLEQRRADARVIMLFKIVHGLVAIPLPSYFEQPSRMTRHSHPLALHQIHTSVKVLALPCSSCILEQTAMFCCNTANVGSIQRGSAVTWPPHVLTQHNCFYPVFNVLDILFNTIISYSFLFPYTFCTVALRRIPPVRNPREGVLQYRKKESLHAVFFF